MSRKIASPWVGTRHAAIGWWKSHTEDFAVSVCGTLSLFRGGRWNGRPDARGHTALPQRATLRSSGDDLHRSQSDASEEISGVDRCRLESCGRECSPLPAPGRPGFYRPRSTRAPHDPSASSRKRRSPLMGGNKGGASLRLYVPSTNEATHPRCDVEGCPDRPGRASYMEGES